MNSDVKDLVKHAEQHGWTCERTRNGHVRFTSPKGATVFGPSTPSDRRSLLNVRAQLRREGLPR